MKVNIYNDDDRQYLQMMQANIERMATNSANCKAWMIVIFTAFIGLWNHIPDKSWLGFVVLIPIIMFWCLDTFYLHLERGLRNRERDFFNIVESGTPDEYKKALFNFKPLMLKKENKEKGFVVTNDRFISKSTAPFYLTSIILIIGIILIQYF